MSIRFIAAVFSFVVTTSVQAQERQWIFDSAAEDAYLIFGVPDTDDIGVSLWCGARSGEVRIFLPEADPAMKPDADVDFTIVVGEETFRIRGRTAVSELAATVGIDAELPATDALFTALRKSDRFKVVTGAVEYVFPLVDADVSGLVELCRKP